MNKRIEFTKTHNEYYLVCEYCGSNMIVRESENDNKVLYVKCNYCNKNLDNFWELSEKMEYVVYEIKHALKKAEEIK